MANAQHTRSAQGTSDEVNLEFDAHRTGADEAHHPPILVLSRDPNLVETVRGYAQQEKDVFGQIADSRSKLAGARTPEDQIKAANEQSAALARLLVISENYPQLRSNESFNRLMDELSGTENRIAVERMRYNERVQEYNTARRRFPANLTAGIFGFKEYPLFNAPPEAERVPRVNFGRS